MARLTLGFGVSDIRGSTGGTTLSKWKGVNYARVRVTPANPKSTAQTAQRNAMTQVVEMWQSLLAATKTPWNSQASGKPKSGFNLFVSPNVKEANGGTPSRVTPDNPDAGAITTVAASGGVAGGEIDVTWATGAAQAGDTVQVYVRDQAASSGRLTDGGSALVSASTLTVSGLTSGATYDVYVYSTSAATPTVYSGTQLVSATAT